MCVCVFQRLFPERVEPPVEVCSPEGWERVRWLILRWTPVTLVVAIWRSLLKDPVSDQITSTLSFPPVTDSFFMLIEYWSEQGRFPRLWCPDESSTHISFHQQVEHQLHWLWLMTRPGHRWVTESAITYRTQVYLCGIWANVILSMTAIHLHNPQIHRKENALRENASYP